uniref:Uncharacterized protein n=1 Tax=Anguilla anguilla TaxID=7936 RepID=A0A0E9SU48_ANGAN
MSHKMVVGFPLYWKRLLVLRKKWNCNGSWPLLDLSGIVGTNNTRTLLKPIVEEP